MKQLEYFASLLVAIPLLFSMGCAFTPSQQEFETFKGMVRQGGFISSGPGMNNAAEAPRSISRRPIGHE